MDSPQLCSELYSFAALEYTDLEKHKEFVKEADSVIPSDCWDLATMSTASHPKVGSGVPPPIVRPLPKNFISLGVRHARLCDGRSQCRGPVLCTFAHNQLEVKAWNRELQGSYHINASPY